MIKPDEDGEKGHKHQRSERNNKTQMREWAKKRLFLYERG